VNNPPASDDVRRPRSPCHRLHGHDASPAFGVVLVELVASCSIRG